VSSVSGSASRCRCGRGFRWRRRHRLGRRLGGSVAHVVPPLQADRTRNSHCESPYVAQQTNKGYRKPGKRNFERHGILRAVCAKPRCHSVGGCVAFLGLRKYPYKRGAQAAGALRHRAARTGSSVSSADEWRAGFVARGGRRIHFQRLYARERRRAVQRPSCGRMHLGETHVGRSSSLGAADCPQILLCKLWRGAVMADAGTWCRRYAMEAVAPGAAPVVCPPPPEYMRGRSGA